MKKFYLLVVLALAILGVGVMVGCGGNSGSGSSNLPPPTTGTLSVSFTGCASTAVTLTVDGLAVSGATCAGYSETLANGNNHTLVASVAGFTLSPATSTASPTTFSISGGATTVVTFTAVANTGTITGTVAGATTGTVSCVSGSTTVSATIGATGSYSCNNVPNGNVVVTPAVSGYTVSPLFAPVAVNGNTMTANFTATANVVNDTIPVSYDYGLSGVTTLTVQDRKAFSVSATPASTPFPGFKVVGGTICGAKFTGAIANGVAVAGCTVHFFGNTVDGSFMLLPGSGLNPNACWRASYAICPIRADMYTYNTPRVKISAGMNDLDVNYPSATTKYWELSADSDYPGAGEGEQHFYINFTPGIPATTNPLRLQVGGANAMDFQNFWMHAYDVSGNELLPPKVVEGEFILGSLLPTFQVGIVEQPATLPAVTPVGSNGIMRMSTNAVSVSLPCPNNNSFGFAEVVAEVYKHFSPTAFRTIDIHTMHCAWDINTASGGPYTSSGTSLQNVSGWPQSDVIGSARRHEDDHRVFTSNVASFVDSGGHVDLSTTAGVMTRENATLIQNGATYSPKALQPNGENPLCQPESELELAATNAVLPTEVPAGLYLPASYLLQEGVPIPASALFLVASTDIAAAFGSTLGNTSYPTLHVILVPPGSPVTDPEWVLVNGEAIYDASNIVDKGVKTTGGVPTCSALSVSAASGGKKTATTVVPNPIN